MDNFYDELAPLYHLIYQDWNAGITRQGKQLSDIISAEWPGSMQVRDVSCGIGTQSIGLALQGYSVAGSDSSPNSVRRAQREAVMRGASIEFSVGDMRHAGQQQGATFDVVISCDNSVPHLLTDADLQAAFAQMRNSLRAGGGCLITVRDYDNEERGRNILKPYGVRAENGKRYLVFQIWDFAGDLYDLTLFFVEEDMSTLQVKTHVMRSKYYAVSISTLMELMRGAGFGKVRRIDNAFHQPVIVATKSV